MAGIDVVAVEVVLEARSECSDAGRAREALNDALAKAAAPARGGHLPGGRGPIRTSPWARVWTVSMSVTGPSASPRSAEGVIVDDAGAVVAKRTVSDRAPGCAPLARAIGAWATLVLDAELELARASAERGTTATPAATATMATPSGPLDENTPERGSAAGGRRRAHITSLVDADVADAPPVAHPTTSLEVGSMVYLRSGASATGGVAGLAPFTNIEIARGWLLRPSAYFGRSTGPIAVQGSNVAYLSHIAIRTDLCRRMPGNYTDRRGIALDVCAGADGALVASDALRAGGASGSVGRVSVGPAANLHGELGAGFALDVRGVVGANLLRRPVLEEAQAPLVVVAAELGLSVRLQ